MPKSYAITGYYNTGFNHGNVPADVSVLQSAEAKLFNAVFQFQDRYLATIKIDGDWDDVKNIDYVAFTADGVSSYYVVDSITMGSGRTAVLSLSLDPLLSCGGVNNISVLGGWASRAHVGASGDGLFGNITPEPWAPSQRLIIRNKKLIHDDSPESSYHFVATTTDLKKTNWYATTLLTEASSATAGSVTFPKVPTLSTEGTTLAFQGNSYQLPGIRIFSLDNEDIRDAIATLRSIGIESCILSMYTVPSQDVMAVSSSEGTDTLSGYEKLTGQTTTYNSGFNYIYGSVKNQKAVCLYNTYTVLSTSSSNTATFDAHELYSEGASPTFKVSADPAPNGTCYCQPTYFEGSAVKYLEHSVAGLPWLNDGFVYSGTSGGAITVANAGRQNAHANMLNWYDNNRDRYTADYLSEKLTRASVAANVNTISAFLGSNTSTNLSNLANGYAAADAGMMFSGAVGVAANVANAAYTAYTSLDPIVDITHQMTQLANENIRRQEVLNYSMGDNLFTANVAANVAPPTLAFPISVNSASYFGNSFMIYQTTLGDYDLARFDKFLTMYGYACDKPFEKSDLNNRTFFNYIKTTDAQLKASNVSMNLTDALAAMFNNGVRIWHVLPNATAYEDNPAKEGT